jgi:hypothetical protein
MEICFNLLGIKARQLLYFLYFSETSLIAWTVLLDDFIVANRILKASPLILAGGI